MARIHAKRLRLFASDYLLSADGCPLTHLDLAELRSRGQFVLDGVTYTFAASGLLGGSYALECEGRTLARATREGLFPRRYRIHAGDRMLELLARGPGRRFTLRHGDRTVGSIAPLRLFSRSAVADFGQPLPLPVSVFLLALVLLYWRTRARASSG